MKRKRIDLLDRFERVKRPLILDGAMGSLLQQKGIIKTDNILWSAVANLTNPKLVKQIHIEYIKSGADIITTNTFRTNPLVFRNSILDVNYNEFVQNSVSIALNAAKNKSVIVAGSNAPAEDCYQKDRKAAKYDLEYNHKKHIELLWESGVDIIWNETQSHMDEIKIICEFCSKNKLPFIVSLFFDKNINLLSGEPLPEAVDFISSYLPTAIGFNCIGESTMDKFLSSYFPKYNWGFYLNCGPSNYTAEEIKCAVNEKEYLKIVKQYLSLKPVFLGACCGSNPKHISAIKKYFDEHYKN